MERVDDIELLPGRAARIAQRTRDALVAEAKAAAPADPWQALR
jgi:hypothetical protein